MKSLMIVQITLLTLLTLLALFAFVVAALAEGDTDSRWQFTGDQQPNYQSLQTDAVKEHLAGCRRWIDSLYDNYVRLNPKFKPLSKDQKYRKAWRRSLVLFRVGDLESRNHCFYRMLSERISQLPNRWTLRTLFCGIIARNLGGLEQKSAMAAEELTEYAMHGKFSAVFTILNKEYRTSPVKFNADVKYYLQLMINKHWPPGNELRDVVDRFLVPDAREILTSERQKFVEDAFERGDYKSVLTTTMPC